MFKFFSIFLLFQELFLWLLLVNITKTKTDKEQFLEDTIQMEYLKNYKKIK